MSPCTCLFEFVDVLINVEGCVQAEFKAFLCGFNQIRTRVKVYVSRIEDVHMWFELNEYSWEGL